jgi:hypothetical protein
MCLFNVSFEHLLNLALAEVLDIDLVVRIFIYLDFQKVSLGNFIKLLLTNCVHL